MRLQALSVISGSSSGIGDATARLLGFEWQPRDPPGARRRATRATSPPTSDAKKGTADAYAVDLGDPQALAATAARIVAQHGTPNILINDAGAGRWLPLLETSAEEAAAMMALPYLAAFNLTRELLPGMLKRSSGQIVNITSVACRLAWPGAVAYTAARAAMETLTNALRADVHGSDVSPSRPATFGTVETNYWKNNPGSREHVPRSSAAMKALTQEEVADTIVRGIELVWRTSFASRTEAAKEIGQYIEGFYNPRRRHSSLGYISPAAFEARLPATTRQKR